MSESRGTVFSGPMVRTLLEPLTRRKPHTYFVNPMSDLFYEGVPDEWIDRHYAVFALCPQHTFIVLTKRPERMQRYLSSRQTKVRMRAGDLAFDIESLAKFDAIPSPPNAPIVYDLGADGDECGCRVQMAWPLPNVWHLVSVEDQKSADERIPLLLQTPSAVRGVSCEPLLGDLNLRKFIGHGKYPGNVPGKCVTIDGETWHSRHEQCRTCGWGFPDDPDWPRRVAGLDWVICGGESGAGARPMHPDWARSLRDQCGAAGVPFFFKQWGEWLPFDQRQPGQVANSVGFECAYESSGGYMLIGSKAKAVNADFMDAGKFGWWRVGKKAAGHLLDGRAWHQFPEVR